MSEFKNPHKNTFWHSPIVLLALLVVVLVFAYNLVGLVKKERETAKNKALMLDKIADLHKREADLTSGIEKLQTDAGKEELIRDKYQVVRPGEKMLVIVDDGPKDTNDEDGRAPHGFLNFLQGMFK